MSISREKVKKFIQDQRDELPGVNTIWVDIFALIYYLESIENKWNCEICRVSYDRDGCPDHGPGIFGGNYD